MTQLSRDGARRRDTGVFDFPAGAGAPTGWQTGGGRGNELAEDRGDGRAPLAHGNVRSRGGTWRGGGWAGRRGRQRNGVTVPPAVQVAAGSREWHCSHVWGRETRGDGGGRRYPLAYACMCYPLQLVTLQRATPHVSACCA